MDDKIFETKKSMNIVEAEIIQNIILKNMEALNEIALKQDILIAETKSYIDKLIKLLSEDDNNGN